ncbi:MAG: hypothetical protein AB7S26_39125 [Sandaracinaceae bacterium]
MADPQLTEVTRARICFTLRPTMSVTLPACGLYLTTAPIDTVPAGRLVYFHNHGDPGPGIYLPASWEGNRARFQAKGHLLPAPDDARHLAPLLAEGFYRVRESFTCCEKRCRQFEADTLVQLGYNGVGDAILFEPEWSAGQLTLPTRGTVIDRGKTAQLTRLRVQERAAPVHEDGADRGLLH